MFGHDRDFADMSSSRSAAGPLLGDKEPVEVGSLLEVDVNCRLDCVPDILASIAPDLYRAARVLIVESVGTKRDHAWP